MDKFRYSFVKLYLWLCGKKVEKIKRIKFADNKIRDVVVFNGKHPLFLGQGFPLFRIIIIHKSVFSKYSKNAQKYILEHERAHSEMNWLFSLPLSILIFGFGILTAISLIAIFSFSALAFLRGGIFIQYAYFSILSFIVYLLLFILISWIFETHADFSAINALGLDNIKKLHKESLSKKTKRSVTEKIISRVMHPPRKWVLWAYAKIYSSN